MEFFCDLLSSLAPWLLVLTMGCSLLILLLRGCAEPFAPGIAFGSLVRRLVNHQRLDSNLPGEGSAASRQLRRRLRRNEWAMHTQLRLIVWIACVMLLSRLLILAAAMIGSCLSASLDKLFTAAISHWVRWDAANYVNLARNGYKTLPELLYLLPLYPLLVRLFSYLCFGHYVFAGFLVSNISLMGASWALYHVINDQYGERSARRAVMLMLFSPLSLFFSVPSAESLFLMLTLLAILCARNRWFGAAVVFGMLASATRLIGFLVFIPIYMEVLKYLHCLDLFERRRSRYFVLLALYTLLCLVIFLGTGSYLIINRVIGGHPFAFVSTLAEEWNESFVSIRNTQAYSIQLAFNYGSLDWQLGTWLPQALVIFVSAMMLLAYSTTMPPADGLYAWLYLFLTMAPSWMLSGPRTVTSLYPIYMMLAVVSRKKWTYLIIMLLSIILMCCFAYMYALVGSVV